MQGYVFDLYLQCQKKQSGMKTKDFLTFKELEFKKKVVEKYEGNIENICFIAAAIRLEEMCFESGMSTKDEFNKKVEGWAKRIKVIADRLDLEYNLNKN